MSPTIRETAIAKYSMPAICWIITIDLANGLIGTTPDNPVLVVVLVDPEQQPRPGALGFGVDCRGAQMVGTSAVGDRIFDCAAVDCRVGKRWCSRTLKEEFHESARVSRTRSKGLGRRT